MPREKSARFLRLYTTSSSSLSLSLNCARIPKKAEKFDVKQCIERSIGARFAHIILGRKKDAINRAAVI